MRLGFRHNGIMHFDRVGGEAQDTSYEPCVSRAADDRATPKLWMTFSRSNFASWLFDGKVEESISPSIWTISHRVFKRTMIDIDIHVCRISCRYLGLHLESRVDIFS
jgi:hypothetical protein